jgi:integrase
MSLYKRGDIWWSRIEVKSKLYQFTTRTRNRNEARSIEAKRRTEIIAGAAEVQGAPTLSTFATQFLNSLPGRVSPQTFRFYTVHLMPLVNSELGECRLDKIGALEIERFVQHRRQKVSTVTVNHNLRTLRRALLLAVEWNVLPKAPKVKLLTGENQREYVIGDEDMTRFANADGLIAKLVPFLVDTGLRRREVIELKWENVNTDERWIFIAHSKSKAGRRRIPLTNRAHKILTELPRDCAFVFSNKGRPLTRDWISHQFLDTRKRLGLPSGCCLHSCRHTSATRMAATGASPFVMQRFFGWSDLKMALRYCHPDSDQLARAVAALD